MHVLFIHQAFPAQFGQLAYELAKNHGWKCSFLIEDLSTCPTPTPEMLQALHLHKLVIPEEQRDNTPTPWPQIYGKFLSLAKVVHDAAKQLPGPPPDLVVGHGGRGSPTAFLTEVLDCPIINYCEYYFAKSHSDISFRVDLPPATEVAPFFPKCINAPVLLGLANMDSGYSATRFQRDTFPERFRSKIEVQFDGIDTNLYRPRKKVPRNWGGKTIPPGTKVVTFVARGLESVRGFDIFLKVARRIAKARDDVLFVIAGTDHVYYGWDALHTGQASFHQWAMQRIEHDPDRFLFLGHIEPEKLAELLCLSDLHLYLTVPFVLSWSLINAMSCGCTVIASDVPPVREVIEPGRTGLIAPLFDADALADMALEVLAQPAKYKILGKAARALIQEKFSLEVCVPKLKDYFERVASAGKVRRE